jgi:hypothetical protein
VVARSLALALGFDGDLAAFAAAAACDLVAAFAFRVARSVAALRASAAFKLDSSCSAFSLLAAFFAAYAASLLPAAPATTPAVAAVAAAVPPAAFLPPEPPNVKPAGLFLPTAPAVFAAAACGFLN